VRRGALIAVLLPLGALLAAGRVPAAQSIALPHALAVIDACVARLDTEVDVGFRRIAMRCPQLSPALAGGGFDRWLPPDWRDPENDLSAGGLEELRELLARELTMRPSRPTPSIERLHEELAHLATPPPRTGMWGTLASWLRRVGGRREGSPVYRRIAHGLRQIELGPATARITMSAALAGLIALAGLTVVNELRVAGALRVRSRRRAQRLPSRGSAVLASGPAVELAGEVGVLLGLVLERLGRIRGLTRLGSLTARELIGAVPLEDSAAASQLTRLLLTAERMRYAGSPPSSGELIAAVNGARTLLARLEAP
jgi:hypothetical protein